MEKIWYIFKDNKEYGPFSVEEVKAFPGLSPSTSVRKEGEVSWSFLKNRAELQGIFFEESEDEKEVEEVDTEEIFSSDDEIVLDMGSRWNNRKFFVYIVVLALLFLYFFYRRIFFL
jgi:hypothetical protein